MPVMRAKRTRYCDPRFLRIGIASFGNLDRTTRNWVYTRSPVDCRKWFRRNELAIRAIDDIKESILRRLHEHLAFLIVDREISENDVLRRVVVPHVTRRRLKVPNVFAGFRAHGDNRRKKQIVAAFWIANRAAPRKSVAR